METEPTTPRKLHPITLVQRFIVSLPGFFLLLFATYRSPDSSNWATLTVTLLYTVVALPFIYLRYARFRYWITQSELVIRSGVLTRQHRNIPLEKIQNVEIVQRLLPRLTGTARVQVVTAGSESAEGVLEFISMAEANRIRLIVRQHHSQSATPAIAETLSEPGAATIVDEPVVKTLYEMSILRVLLSGAFRFSLLYIAIGFSAIQFIEPDPQNIAEWVLGERVGPALTAARQSPYAAAAVVAVVAAALSWLSGILVNLNKYYGFRLWREEAKVAKRSGLLTLSEGSIPLKKIQALVFRTNPVMRMLNWWSLQLQTMGLDVREAGHRMAVPFAQWEEIADIVPNMASYALPGNFERVSAKRVSRLFVRYTIGLLLVVAALSLWWSRAWMLTAVLPLLLLTAWTQWRHHGYSLTHDAIAVRRGVLRHRIWLIPATKMQVFYTSQSIFQRRRNLKSVYIDSAGASPLALPTIFDLEAEDADELVGAAYASFKSIAPQGSASSPVSRSTQSPK